MKKTVAFIVGLISIFIAGIIVLITTDPYIMRSCRKEEVPPYAEFLSFEAEIRYVDGSCIYNNFKDADAVPYLKKGVDYVLYINGLGHNNRGNQIMFDVNQQTVLLKYDDKKMEIAVCEDYDDNWSMKFLIRGLEDCGGEPIEIHHATKPDEEITPCTIYVKF